MIGLLSQPMQVYDWFIVDMKYDWFIESAHA